MKSLVQLLMLFAIIGVSACSKEKEPEIPPPPPPQPQILNPQIETLKKAEQLPEQSAEAIAQQRKQIEEQSQ